MNSDCPPKADAGLKPGECKVKLEEVRLTELVHSTHPVPDICGWSAALTHLAENAQSGLQRDRLKKEEFCFCSVECSGGELLSLSSLFLFEVLTRLFI